MLNVMVAIGANVKVQGPATSIESHLRAAMDLNRPIEILTEAPAEPTPGQRWVVWPDLSRAYIASASGGSIAVSPLPASPAATISQQFRLSEYINFVLVLALGTVIGFQTPMVVMLLGWIGFATPEWFRRQRRYALFACGVASAIITPSSDLVSMLVLMLPLYALYELGIVLLVLAPASRVAEGKVFTIPRWRWRGEPRVHHEPAGSENSPAATSNSTSPAQAEHCAPSSESAPNAGSPTADSPRDRRS
jgi:hypothetical protein